MVGALYILICALAALVVAFSHDARSRWSYASSLPGLIVLIVGLLLSATEIALTIPHPSVGIVLTRRCLHLVSRTLLVLGLVLSYRHPHSAAFSSLEDLPTAVAPQAASGFMKMPGRRRELAGPGDVSGGMREVDRDSFEVEPQCRSAGLSAPGPTDISLPVTKSFKKLDTTGTRRFHVDHSRKFGPGASPVVPAERVILRTVRRLYSSVYACFPR
jgi:hypothetical protein